MTNWLIFHLQTNVSFLKMDPCLMVLFRIRRKSHVPVVHIHMKMDMFTSTQKIKMEAVLLPTIPQKYVQNANTKKI